MIPMFFDGINRALPYYCLSCKNLIIPYVFIYQGLSHGWYTRILPAVQGTRTRLWLWSAYSKDWNYVHHTRIGWRELQRTASVHDFVKILCKHIHGWHTSLSRLMFPWATLRWQEFILLRGLGSSGPCRCLIRTITVVIKELLFGLDSLLGENANPMVSCHQHYLNTVAH